MFTFFNHCTFYSVQLRFFNSRIKNKQWCPSSRNSSDPAVEVNSARNSLTAFAMVEIPPRKSMSNNSSENGIMVSSPSADADDLSNGNHKTPTSNNKMPDRLAPPDVCHRHKHLKRFVHSGL